MRGYYITFRSVTFAQRGERMLRQAGVGCSLQRTPRWMEEQGCGYCLGVQDKQIMDAMRLLRQGKIPFRKVYFLSPGKEATEVSL